MLSIVIPVFNQHDMTADCISAVREHTTDFELIVVDNGSVPPIDGATVRNEQNLGFPPAVNQGIQAAQGDIIILLNNDVIVTPGWADRLCEKLDEYAIVSPLTNYCAGIQRVVVPAYGDQKELNERAAAVGREHAGETEAANFVIGFCMTFRKSLFDEIGEFDESLWPCSGEEIDFCFRARKAGHKIAIALDVYVHHFGSQTFQDMAKEIDYGAICERNDAHLAKKWGAGFWQRQAA